MYFKYHCQLPEGYFIPTDFRNVPSYSWLHHLMMSSFTHWLSADQRKDCYWILRTYDSSSFDVAFRLPKGQRIEDRFKHVILDTIEFSNSGDYKPGTVYDYDSLKVIKISEREFLDILCHTDGRLMGVKEYIDRKGQRTIDYVKPLELF